MALTQDQWFQKLKGFVPTWYFETEQSQVAHFEALAKVLSEVQTDSEYNLSQTFITSAVDPDLDLMGSERSVDRLDNEMDTSYRPRVQSLVNKVNLPALKALIDLLLIVGTCTINEDYNSALYLDRDVYISRGYIFLEEIKDAFSIIVENQVHSPYSFISREYFADREDFIGTGESPQALFDLIVDTVNREKAFGCLYRVIERMGA